MKRFLLLTVAVATIVLAGCDKDKDGEGGNGNLVGKWEAQTEHDLTNGEWVLSASYDANERVWEFTSDGKMKDYWEGELEYTYSYSYNASKKELTLIGIVCEVETLTASTLIIIQKSIDNEPTTYKTTFKKK